MRQWLVLLILCPLVFFLAPEVDRNHQANAGDLVFANGFGGSTVVQVDPRGPIRRFLFPNRGRRVNVAVNRGNARVFVDGRFGRRRFRANNVVVPSNFAVNRVFFNARRPVVVASPSPASFGVFGNSCAGHQAVLVNGGFVNTAAFAPRVRVRVRGGCGF